MKFPSDRTKVVVRHLPPVISQSVLFEQIDARFAGRYGWFCFRSGKNSQKHQKYSRAYFEFKKPEYVIEFAEFFDGHIFVNEKGFQFKAIVEYAPSQHVPKQWPKNDGRDGTVFKDPEYLEFLELLAKSTENLPSAEIQLERREAERAGQPKESLIVTPLMDFVRQKRAAKSGPQRLATNGKPRRRASKAAPGNSRSSSTKRSSEKRRVSTSMYVLRDSTKKATMKEKSTYFLLPRREEENFSDKPGSATVAEIMEDETACPTDKPTFGTSGTLETRKRRVLLLKGKEKEISHSLSGISQQQSVISPAGNSPSSITSKQSQRGEASGRMIKSILSNKEPCQHQSDVGAGPSEQQSQPSYLVKDKRPPRPTNIHTILKDHIDNISSFASATEGGLDVKIAGYDSHMSVRDRQGRRPRNNDRNRSFGSRASGECPSLCSSPPLQLMSGSFGSELVDVGAISKSGVEDADSNNKSTVGKAQNLEAGDASSRIGCGNNLMPAQDPGESKVKVSVASRSGDMKGLASGRYSQSSVENGSLKHGGRRGPPHGLKEVDGSLNLSEGKPSRRGGATGYGSHEKQIWVQKSGSGT